MSAEAPDEPGEEPALGATPLGRVRPGGRPPSMADVAVLAGVSHQTVSRVLNGHPSVRDETRARVREAIRSLGYRRNVAARTLVTRQTRTIGLIGVAAAVFGQSQALIGMEKRAREEGWFLTIALVLDWGEDSVVRAVEHVLEQGVDALALMGTSPQVIDVVRGLDPGVPVVTTGGSSGDGMPVWASVDHAQGERLALEHLVGLGHRKILHMRGPEQWSMFRTRHAAYLDFMREAGLEPRVVDCAGYLGDGYRVGNQLVEQGDLPTAIVAANDQTAFGAARALRQAGVVVPDDVSLVGYDDAYGSDYAMPALTTVHQDFGLVGAHAVELVLELTSGADPAPRVVEPRLVVRESTAPPRA